MVPSAAVTSTVMALAPKESGMAALAVPLATVARLAPLPTLTVALALFTVGVIFRCVAVPGTVAV